MLLALLFMRFEAIPSLRKLCRRLERRRYAREICEFTGEITPKHNTFSLFISRAGPDTIEGAFNPNLPSSARPLYSFNLSFCNSFKNTRDYLRLVRDFDFSPRCHHYSNEILT